MDTAEKLFNKLTLLFFKDSRKDGTSSEMVLSGFDSHRRNLIKN